jgi:transposase
MPVPGKGVRHAHGDRDNDYLMLEITAVRARQQAANGKRGQGRVARASRSGLTTKVYILADTLGRPLRFRITAGQAPDITAAADLLKVQYAKAVLADKAYDSNDLCELIAEAVIPSKPNCKVFIPHDEGVYKRRNQIERCFGRLKHFWSFAAR